MRKLSESLAPTVRWNSIPIAAALEVREEALELDTRPRACGSGWSTWPALSMPIARLTVWYSFVVRMNLGGFAAFRVALIVILAESTSRSTPGAAAPLAERERHAVLVDLVVVGVQALDGDHLVEQFQVVEQAVAACCRGRTSA